VEEEAQEQKRKKKKKRKQSVLLEEEKLESDTFHELVEVLDELEKEGKYVDVQICPRVQKSKGSQGRNHEWRLVG
jgi:hypothetical protein